MFGQGNCLIEVTQITKESSCNPLSESGILNLQYEFEEVLVMISTLISTVNAGGLVFRGRTV